MRTRTANDVPAGFMGAYAGDKDATSAARRGSTSDSAPRPASRRHRQLATSTPSATRPTTASTTGSPSSTSSSTRTTPHRAVRRQPADDLGHPRPLNGSEGQLLGSTFDKTHDALVHFVSKLADRRLQLDVIAGYHYEDPTPSTTAAGAGPGVLYAAGQSLATFEPGMTPARRRYRRRGDLQAVPGAQLRRRRLRLPPAHDGAAHLGLGGGDLLRAPRRHPRASSSASTSRTTSTTTRARTPAAPSTASRRRPRDLPPVRHQDPAERVPTATASCLQEGFTATTTT